MSTCRSCNKPILWAITTKGKRMPVDVAPDPAGNVEITAVGSEYHAHVIADPKTYTGNPQHLHKSHFATCPYAEQHRGKRKK